MATDKIDNHNIDIKNWDLVNVNSHSNKDMTSIITSRLINASTLVWRLKIQTNHNDVANIGNAKNCFRVSIHFPGFGRELIKFGYIASIRYGMAKPIPRDANTGIVVPEGWINAYPSAAPINGAVHGEATITARTPVKNDP